MIFNLEKYSERTVKLIKFFLPFVLALIGMIILQIALHLVGQGSSSFKLIALMFVYFIPPLGKETLIPLGISGGTIDIPFLNQTVVVPSIDPLIMAISIAFVDIMVALFLVWNYDLAKTIPLVGDFMVKVENIGKRSSDKYGWVKPLRFIGIVLFVMVPFQGSGGLVGSILGRLIGMKPQNTFLAITIGSLVGCTLIAFFADAILDVLVTNFLYGILIIIVLLVIGIMIFVSKKALNKNSRKL